jgi:hypothetical protein
MRRDEGFEDLVRKDIEHMKQQIESLIEQCHSNIHYLRRMEAAMGKSGEKTPAEAFAMLESFRQQLETSSHQLTAAILDKPGALN